MRVVDVDNQSSSHTSESMEGSLHHQNLRCHIDINHPSDRGITHTLNRSTIIHSCIVDERIDVVHLKERVEPISKVPV